MRLAEKLDWKGLIKATPSHPVSLRSILILYHICQDVPGSVFLLGFPTTYILQKKIRSKNLTILLFLSGQIQLHNKILQI
jgi:hypothetical protein